MLWDSSVKKKLSAMNRDETCWWYLKPLYAEQPSQNTFYEVNFKEVTFSFKAISVTSTQLKLVLLKYVYDVQFCVLCNLKVLLFRTAFVSYKKDRPNPSTCLLGQVLLFGFAERLILLALLFLTRALMTCLLDETVQQRLFQAVPWKTHYLH